MIIFNNCPQFVSSEFETFHAANGICCLMSTPFNPWLNGAAKRLFHTFKSQMLTFCASHSPEKALWLFVSSYHAQPCNGASPADLLHGRRHRTLMHVFHHP